MTVNSVLTPASTTVRVGDTVVTGGTTYRAVDVEETVSALDAQGRTNPYWHRVYGTFVPVDVRDERLRMD